jgi:hypothetical protein
MWLDVVSNLLALVTINLLRNQLNILLFGLGVTWGHNFMAALMALVSCKLFS